MSTAYSSNHRPDIIAYNEGELTGGHLLLDVKVFSPIGADGQPGERGDVWVGFSSTERRATTETDRHYADARQRGHTANFLLHSVFGGVHDHGVKLLDRLNKLVKGRAIDQEETSDSETGPNHRFRNIHASRLSLAAQAGAARQIHDSASAATPEAGVHARE